MSDDRGSNSMKAPVLYLILGWLLALTVWGGIAWPVFSVVYNSQRHDDSEAHRATLESRQRRDEDRQERTEANQRQIAETLRRIEARMGGGGK